MSSTKLNNFYTRTLTTLVLFPTVFYIVYVGHLLLFLLLFVAIMIASYEWNNLSGRWPFGVDGMIFTSFIMVSFTLFYMNKLELGLTILLIGVYVAYLVSKIRSKSEIKPVFPSYLNRPLWYAIGILYLGFGFGSIGYLAQVDPYNLTIIWIFLLTVANDVFAYIFGSLIGGKKIAPKISPGKSWSGLLFASIGTTLVSYVFAIIVKSNNEAIIILIGFITAFVAHFGDMLESFFKRYADLKDSSNIIPGHGGVLDRVDALIMVAFFISIISLILGKSPLFY